MTRFRVWRSAVGGALATVWLVIVGWVVVHATARGGLPSGAVWGVGLACLATATVFARQLAAVRPFELRWDGQCWFLASSSLRRADDEVAGDVAIAVDLGDWLLLRFTPERRSSARLPHWLPLQRRGLEPGWHALRCAVHSPRPAAGSADVPAG